MPKNKGKRGKNRRRGKEEADGEKIKEDGVEIKSPPLSRRASEMSPKSPSERSTDTEKQSVFGKVCIICRGLRDLSLQLGSLNDIKRWRMDFSLFLLDLDAEWESSSRDVPVNPDMCISSFNLGLHAFCVLGSTLYLFATEKRDVFSYDLSLIQSVPSSSPDELTMDKLSTDTPDMTYIKSCPIGCQTPDGRKMIVFSSRFFVNRESIGNFELFDGDKWIVLPDLHPLLRVLGCFIVYVISYSFIMDDEPLLLITTEVGNFTLNIEQLDRGWSRWKDLELPNYRKGLAMLVRDTWRLMDWFEWVDGQEPKPSHPWKTDDGYYPSGGGITWLSPPDCFCVLRCHMKKETMQPRLTVDVRGFDDDGASGPKLKKRIEFVLGIRMHDLFETALLQPVKKQGA